MIGDPAPTRFDFQSRPDWGDWVTPKLLKDKPIHRWYTFPHSFTSELVHALIEDWGLGPKDQLLDPFCGAGTALLAAKERGIPAIGYDLSPLAVLVAKVKASSYDRSNLTEMWEDLKGSLGGRWPLPRKEYPDLVQKALPGRLLGAFEMVVGLIERSDCTRAEKNFFLLALLAVLPEFSRAVATGGWLKWIESDANEEGLLPTLDGQVETMLQDLEQAEVPGGTSWHAASADARGLPDDDDSYSAVVTSPPYPNRHDYTRVFGVELMFAFLDWDEARALRYQTFHSHPEARPERPPLDAYRPPASLLEAVAKVRSKEKDSRVPRMLEGYFADMFVALREVRRVCKPGAMVALVVGNVQYRGVPIVVDEFTAEVGEQAGLSCQKLLVARHRGNSAQQMKIAGKNPSRETVVVFSNP